MIASPAHNHLSKIMSLSLMWELTPLIPFVFSIPRMERLSGTFEVLQPTISTEFKEYRLAVTLPATSVSPYLKLRFVQTLNMFGRLRIHIGSKSSRRERHGAVKQWIACAEHPLTQ